MASEILKQKLAEMVVQMRLPGRKRFRGGLLFKGGKARERLSSGRLVARGIGGELHRVDLRSIVTKYIGETEKNLREVFIAAERNHDILFFDEADGLFGKRSEVKDSHDRFANLETSYFLKQLEKFKGLAILATNEKELPRRIEKHFRFVINLEPDYTKIKKQNFSS